MVKFGIRRCDVCEEEIPISEKYSVTVLKQGHAELFRFAMQEDPDLAATFTEDADGERDA